MDYLECVKRWPAAYTLMATIMDDVVIDETKARSKWGRGAVTVAKEYNNSAIGEGTIRVLMASIAGALGINARLESKAEAEPIKAKVNDPQPAGGSTDKAPVATIPGGVASRSRGKGKRTTLTGTVTYVGTEEKPEQFRSGPNDVRHVMHFKPSGRSDALKGTIPAFHVGKLGVGDEVRLDAEFHNTYFRYPQNLKIINQPDPTRKA